MKFTKKTTGTGMVLLALMFALIVSSCGKTPVEPTLDANVIFTQAVQTVAAQLTNTAMNMPTATNSPTIQPTNTSMPPTATATLALSSVAPLTSVTVTLAPNPNKMEFLGDVTIPDGQIIPAGSKFIKTWKVKNIGNTTWTTNFKIRNWAGDRYGAAASILLAKEVKPGETTDISIEFTAPLNNGEYLSMWILSDEDEANFGVPFYVKFVVGVVASATSTQPPAATTAAPTVAPTETASPTATPTS